MDWLSSFINFIRSSVKGAFVIFLASGILLFAPANWLARMRVDQFVDDYGTWIRLAFLLSVSLVLVEPLSWLGNVLKSAYAEHKLKNEIKSAICGLDVREKAVLREFFLEDRHTVVLPKEHPVVAGLISEGILEVVGSEPAVWDMQRGYTRWSIRINSKIRRYLSPEMLGMPSNPTEEELRELRRNRPDFL